MLLGSKAHDKNSVTVNDTCSPSLPESPTANSSNLGNSLGFPQESEDAKEQFIAEIAASLEHESDGLGEDK